MISIPDKGIRLSQDEALNLWNLVAEYPLPFGPEYLNYKLKWEFSYAALALREYKKFAFLALLSETEITPSEQIDEVWHLHILHTADYAVFAKKCGRFLHHAPGMPSGRPRFNQQYLLTHRFYVEVFGEDPPREAWPLGRQSVDIEGPPVSRVLDLYLARQRQSQPHP